MDFLIDIDQRLLLALNGSDSLWLDQVMAYVTRTSTWIPITVVLLVCLLRTRPWREVILFAVCLALVILVCDQFASSLCKPLFQRFRPSHEPVLEGLVDLVEGRRGGRFGFISSHAANTFGAFAFIAFYLRRVAFRWNLILPTVLTIFLWASLSSYSRIYLGLHYPGDILAGAVAGLLFGYLSYRLMCFLAERLFHRPVTPEATSPLAFGSQPHPQGFAPAEVWLLPITFFVTLLTVAVLAAF
ncbi:MAG: phosphatase PAP2 family protein [Bacteroidales bacterium]|nr:phosphatase PAP2 family protein [Bacteroidales bacterium]